MKKLLLGALLLLSMFSFSQTLESDSVDEFTKAHIKATSWEYLQATMSWTLDSRVRQINDRYILELKLMPIITHINVSDPTMIKLVNGEFITIYPNNSQVSCKGCGAHGFAGSAAYGISINYELSTLDIEKLKQYGIEKIRIYHDNVYNEFEIKESKSKRVLDALNILQ